VQAGQGLCRAEGRPHHDRWSDSALRESPCRTDGQHDFRPVGATGCSRRAGRPEGRSSDGCPVTADCREDSGHSPNTGHPAGFNRCWGADTNVTAPPSCESTRDQNMWYSHRRTGRLPRRALPVCHCRERPRHARFERRCEEPIFLSLNGPSKLIARWASREGVVYNAAPIARHEWRRRSGTCKPEGTWISRREK